MQQSIILPKKPIVRDMEFRPSFCCNFKKLRCKSLFVVNVTFKSQILKLIFYHLNRMSIKIVAKKNVKPILHFLAVYWQWCPKFRVSNCISLLLFQCWQKIVFCSNYNNNNYQQHFHDLHIPAKIVCFQLVLLHYLIAFKTCFFLAATPVVKRA
jgi:hypothetical protein